MENNFEQKVPWEEIMGILEGNPSEEDQVIFQQWMREGTENQQYFDQIKKIWETDSERFAYYLSANPQKSWESLHQKIFLENTTRSSATDSSIPSPPSRGRIRMLYTWVALASIVLLLLGFSFWIFQHRSMQIFQTSGNQKNTITLSDGTQILLLNSSLLEIPRDYGTRNRGVYFIHGSAEFMVHHQSSHPFTVHLGKTLVRDMGTIFTIHRGKEKIDLLVQSGKVVFIQKGTQESHQLTAGMSMSFHIAQAHFGKIRVVSLAQLSSNPSLKFESTPLKQVVLALNKYFGAALVVDDSSLANQKLTVNLNGVSSLDTMLQIIGATLDLKFVTKNGKTLVEAQKNGY
ncbi:MAG: FecR family protein [Chitinophagaceae bacterium]